MICRSSSQPRFKRLAKEVWPEDVYRAGGDKLFAELEDHGRGFIISTVVGKAIIVPVEQFLHGGSQKYCRIDDRTPDAVRLQLAEVLKAMEPHIADAIRAKQLIGRRSVVVEIAPNGT